MAGHTFALGLNGCHDAAVRAEFQFILPARGQIALEEAAVLWYFLYMRSLVPVLFGIVLAASVAAHAAPSLRATSQSQADQNRLADDDHLSRMQDKEMLQRWARLELLVPVKEKTRDYYLHAVPSDYRYLRPWARLLLERLANQFRARFGQPLRVTSLVRTVSYQRQLARRNGNAAAASGPKASAHLTGACLDISKKGMTRSQQAWVRNVLYQLRSKKYLYAIEEFQQPTFHVLVHRRYEDYVAQRTSAAKR